MWCIYFPDAESGDLLVFYRFLLFVWIFLGLAWLSTLLSVLQDIYNSALETGEHKLEHQLSKRVHSISNHHHKGQTVSEYSIPEVTSGISQK